MMNANVRRLVFDLSPRPIIWIQLIASLFLIYTSIEWWRGHNATTILIMATWYTCILSYVSKIQTWKTLPVNINEIRKAQFCIILVVPWLLPFACISFGFWGASYFFPLKVSHRELLALISAVIFMGSSIGFSIFIRQMTMRDKTGALFYSELLSFLPVCMSFYGGFQLVNGDNPTIISLILLILCGVASLSLVLLALIWIQKLPVLLPLDSNPSRGARPSDPSPSTLSRAYRPPTGRSGVWRLVASSLGPLVPAVCVTFGIIPTVVLALNYGLLPTSTTPMLYLKIVPPIFCALLLIPALMEPQRVRGTLPVSALGRTLALQLVVPALLLPALVLVIALGTLLHPEAMTPRWWIGCGMTSLCAWSFIAIARPVALRLGRLGVGMLCVVFTFLFSLTMALGTREGRDDGSMSLAIIGLLIITLIAGWVWTYVELAYWRKAYQSQGLAADRWRGAAT